ncbi:hypothetical protein V6N13_038392 [Hibiscus sabdariffa]
MADAIVSLAVERISDLLIHESVFMKDLKEQIQILRALLMRMQYFLKNVDRMPEQDNHLLSRVSEIRDLASDAEDVMDSFILERAHQGSSSVSRMPLRFTYAHAEGEDVVSLEVSTKHVLDQLMTEEDRYHVVVSIVGMEGIGKTTLARKVYNHVDVKRHFDCLASVSVSRQCNPREVLLGVLMKVISPSNNEREKELVQLWIAEGFISPSRESEDMLMEDVGELFLKELIDRNLVEVVRRDYTGTTVKTCRINDVSRNLCIEKAKEEKFLEIVVPPLTESGVTLAEPMLRRIAIHPSKRSFKYLRVLNLVRMDVYKWHVSSEIGNLHHLRYLRIEGTLYSNILTSFGTAKKCVGSQGLETLKYIVVDEKLIENDVVSGLTNIRRLGIVFKRLKDVMPILKSLMELPRLASLQVKFKRGLRASYLDLERLSQCYRLSKLELVASTKEDPFQSHHVLKFLPPTIVKLTLSGCGMKQDPMAVLGQLSFFRILKLQYGAYKGSEMICSAGGFLVLDFLHMSDLELKKWEIKEGAMPCL